MRRFLLLAFLPLVVQAQTLRLELTRHSLTGAHYRYRQYVHGLPVIGGEVEIDEGREPRILRHLAHVDDDVTVPENANAALNVDGKVRFVRREIREARRLEPVAYYYDATTNELLRVEPLYYSVQGRVFDPNPVVATNNPNLQDMNNSASAVPDSAYRIVDLPDLDGSGSLSGPNVRIVDVEAPNIPPIPASQALTDRSRTGFEEVNAYFHIDASQRYLQSLGYVGERRLVDYAIPVDAHAANGTDNSYFIPELRTPAHGTLYFGDGGTDDAEDADLLLHEFGHAILDWIAPNAFTGPFGGQARAIGEGFGDYWAFSAHYDQRVASGRDAFCFADWDTRCWNDDPSQNCGYRPNTDCFRRLDSPKTMADYIDGDTAGTEHLNGMIWSSALREIFLAIGKRTTDTIVLESVFGVQSNPTFATLASRMVIADRLLYGGAHVDVICAAMTKRGIFAAEGCGATPHGEFTVLQSAARDVAIPDSSPTGITSTIEIENPWIIDNLYVRVDIQHSSRGDLRITLIAPDGTEYTLQAAGLDRTADLHVTYGLDVPVAALAALHGKPARGLWTLRVQDLNPLDAGVLRSWALLIQYVGDQPLASNPGGSLIIPVAGHLFGANRDLFTTDLRIANPESNPITSTVTFSPCDGGSFSTVNLTIPPGQVVAFDEVVSQLFHSGGIGHIAVSGGKVSSRTYLSSAGGTVGQSVHPGGATTSRTTERVILPRIENTSGVRAQIGFAETAGGFGLVHVRLFDAGHVVSEHDYAIAPFGQTQFAVDQIGNFTADVSVVSGDAVVAPYASLVQNESGDANYIAAVPVPDHARIEAVPAMTGRWRTDVWITTVSAPSSNDIVMTYTRAADGVVIAQRFRAPVVGETIVRNDVVASLDPTESLGVLYLELPAGVVATSRMYFDSRYGEAIPFAETSTGTDIVRVDNNADFRTNIALYPETEAALVRVETFDAAGAKLDEQLQFLRQSRLWTFPITAPVTDGRVRVTAVGGRVRAFASVIDNRTGDLTFVPAQ